MIAKEVRQLYELLWYPGRTMHSSWWQLLDMGVWQDVYSRSKFCRSQIDSLIRTRALLREYSVPSVLGDIALMLMSRTTRIPSIVVAVGIMATGRREYLLLRSYRRELENYLSDRNCEELLAVSWADVDPIGHVPEASIVAVCEQLGMCWIDRDMKSDAAWGGVRLQLQAPGHTSVELEAPPVSMLPRENVIGSLLRLGRLL
ncbi:type III secretion system domain-containing protein [Burkholderia sp. Bp8986]|uniref:type III secretion system domain-containing protein n=1 Tax=Burkholderia sp. Bp8986 TaxID=2184550 RepID=UPI000F592CB7|nr:type III secretion system domain-containing protein [Burkholderia sp. Bp8986]RQS44922.1 hypothetical protein DID99_33880 [Burkholderia sp. Bp8986]